MVQVEAGSLLRVPMSAEEYAGLGEAKFHEYYDGCLVVNPPTMRHALAATNLVITLVASRGERLVVTGSGWSVGGEIFVPDLMVIEAAALAEPLLVTPPYLVVEILSPSTKRDDRGKKLGAYAAGGAGWYWIVDLDVPEVAVFKNSEGAFVEVQRAQATASLSPMGVRIDPRKLARP
jgi:Uma2 family endonuclease